MWGLPADNKKMHLKKRDREDDGGQIFQGRSTLLAVAATAAQ
jgi:hypothetical protein